MATCDAYLCKRGSHKLASSCTLFVYLAGTPLQAVIGVLYSLYTANKDVRGRVGLLAEVGGYAIP